MNELSIDPKEWTQWQSWSTITLYKHSGFNAIGLLLLNRPEKLNAINQDMISDLHACLDLLRRAFDCRVLLICGAGRLFCAGIDLGASAAGDSRHDWAVFPDKVKTMHQIQHEVSDIMSRLRRIPQPVISVVHGAAVGGGMAMVNASDIVFSTRNSRFINAFVKIGLSGADCGSSYFLPRIVGFHRSAELLYTGRDLSAEEAHQWGYVNRLVDQADRLLPAAVEFASEFMLTRSPLGLRLTKDAININMDSPGLDPAIQLEDRNQTLAGQTADVVEGVMAFFGKRKPVYGSR